MENLVSRGQRRKQWRSFNSATAVSRGKLPSPVRRPRRTPARFNSATAVSRGKLRFYRIASAAGVRLQFGHGCEPWKTIAQGITGATTNKLQFGHGCEPWKTPELLRQRRQLDRASIRPRL